MRYKTTDYLIEGYFLRKKWKELQRQILADKWRTHYNKKEVQND